MGPIRPVHWQALSLPKRGHSAEEYEDAFAGNAALGRFAIADGATESSFAGLWARLLVNRFLRQPVGLKQPWADWLPPLQQRWNREVRSQPLPWYAEEKVDQGAYATFLGLVLQGERWQAVAVGDSCLFHVREGQLLQAFPVSRSEEFGNTPALVGSRATTPEMVQRRAVRAEGDWQVGDWLLLMTDALAQWFLAEGEADRRPWEAVRQLLTGSAGPADMSAWVEPLRQQGALRNDDVTFLALSLKADI